MRETRRKQLTHDIAFEASRQPSAILDKEYDHPCISHFAFLGSRGKLSLYVMSFPCILFGIWYKNSASEYACLTITTQVTL